MVKLTEEVTIINKPVTVDKVVGFVCDSCGREVRNPQYANDGFTFNYRVQEEDECIIMASDICDDCLVDDKDDYFGRLEAAIAALLKLAPHAKMRTRLAEFERDDLGDEY